MGLALSTSRPVRSKATTEHSLQTHLLLALLVGLAACGGEVTAPSEHAERVSGAPDGAPDGDSTRPTAGNPLS